MTNELPEFDPLDFKLSELAVKLGAPSFAQASGDIGERLWPFFRQAAEHLIAAGEDPARVGHFLELTRERFYILPEGVGVELPPDLQDEIGLDFAAEVAATPAESVQRLDEKVVEGVTEFRMVIYHNESKHPGRPHVKISLEGGDIIASISHKPEVLAGKRGLRDEAAALKCVKKHRKRLRKFWDNTRPDDQKIAKPPPAAAAAKAKRKR